MTELEETLFNIGSRMAQDLQEYIDAGEEGGSDMGASKALVEEWELIYQEHGVRWQDQFAYGVDDTQKLKL